MIWYSHVNEDNRVERSAWGQDGYTHCFCIAGSGGRFIALLDQEGLQYAEDVITLDVRCL